MYKVIRASVDYLPRIVDMKLRMFAESGRTHLLARNAASVIVEDYQRMYGLDIAAHFLAVDGSTVMACAGAFLKSDIPYCYFVAPTYGFIGDVYTCPEARRQGLARRLSVDAINWLRERGVSTIRLLASEAARPIYVSLGFSPTDEMTLQLASEVERGAV